MKGKKRIPASSSTREPNLGQVHKRVEVVIGKGRGGLSFI
jgi:hypothetical protein